MLRLALMGWALLSTVVLAYVGDLSQHQCGVRYEAQGRILNGTDAPKGKWPWLARLLIESRAYPGMIAICTGSVISPRFILTAAHCLVGVDSVVVSVGSPDIRRRETIHVRAKAIHIHSLFPGRKGLPGDDIAIVELSRSLAYSSSVQPICLTKKFNELQYSEAIIAGWGRTLKTTLTYVLQEGTVELMPYPKCKSYYRFVPVMAPSKHLCAVGRSSDVDYGDSGSPLVVKMLDSEKVARYYQVGITSFGTITEDPEVPNVYTRVSTYCPWIAKVTENEAGCS